MKNLKALFGAILFMVGFVAPTFAQVGPPAPSNGVWLLIDTNYNIGSSVDGFTKARLTFKNTTASAVTALQFRVFYDKNAFSQASVTLVGSASNLDLQAVDNNANGYITITLVYTGSSNVYTIPEGEKFELKLNHISGTAFHTLPSIGNLTWTGAQTYAAMAAEQAGNDLALSTHNYGGVFLRPDFTFSGSFVNVNGTPAKNLPLALEKKVKTGGTWAQHDTYLTDVNGQFTFTEAIDTTYYDVRLAINGDTMGVGNVISVADAQLINQWVLGTATQSGYDFYAADVNGSNNTTIADAYGVFGRISGRFTQWPNNVKDVKFFTAAENATITASPNTSFVSSIPGVTNFTYNILPTGPNTVTFHVLVAGDANNTGFNMARMTPIQIQNPTNAPNYVIDETVIYDSLLPSVEINVPSITVNEGSLVEIPVKVITGDKKIGALQFALMYDQDILEFKEVKNSQKAMNWLSFINTQDSVIEWGGYDTSGDNVLVNGDDVFSLLFIAKTPQSQWPHSPLYTSRKMVGNEFARDMNLTPANGMVTVKMIGGHGFITSQGNMAVYPNPTTSDVYVNFRVEVAGEVSLTIYDITGRGVQEVISQYLPKGDYIYSANMSNLTNGVYLTTLQTKNSLETKKTVLIK